MCAKSFVFHPARSSGVLGNGWLGAVDGVFVSMVARRSSDMPVCLLPMRIRHWTAPCHLCRERLIHATSSGHMRPAQRSLWCAAPLERQVLPPHFLVVLKLGNRPTKAHLPFFQDIGAIA